MKRLVNQKTLNTVYVCNHHISKRGGHKYTCLEGEGGRCGGNKEIRYPNMKISKEKLSI